MRRRPAIGSVPTVGVRLSSVPNSRHRQWTNETLDQVFYESIVSEISTYGRNQDESVEDVDERSRPMRWAWESERLIFIGNR